MAPRKNEEHTYTSVRETTSARTTFVHAVYASFVNISSFKVVSIHRNIRAKMIRKLEEHMAKLMSKSELVQKIADQHSNGLSRKDIKGVIESLASVGYKELRKREPSLCRIREICCH